MARRSLCRELSRIGSTMRNPWVLGGDFNATLYDYERKSTAAHPTSFDRDFYQWFEESSIMNLGFMGPMFTWKRENSEALLDRFFANTEWCQNFSNARVTHLPFFKSDHLPVLLQLDRCSEKPNRPFRFIAAWVLHENFNDFLKGNGVVMWSGMTTWHSS